MRAGWVVLAAAAFLVSAVAQFPGTVAYRWFAPDGIRLSGIEGTVWSGRAALGSAGSIGIHDLRWQLRPWSLLFARPSARIESGIGDGFLQADVRVGMGEIALTGLRSSCSLSVLSGVLPIAGIRGQMSMTIAELVVRDGRPVRAVGELRLGNLSVPSLVPGSRGETLAMGNFSIALTGTAGLAGTFEDQGGPLEVRGSADLGTDGRYEIRGGARARPAADPVLAQGLEFLTGPPDASGMREFSFSGTL